MTEQEVQQETSRCLRCDHFGYGIFKEVERTNGKPDNRQDRGICTRRHDHSGSGGSVGIEIPSLCYLKDINEISACRVCCVEVEGEGKLVPSCNNVVQEGMVIHTNTPRVRGAPHQC